MNAEEYISRIAYALLVQGEARKDPIHRRYIIFGKGMRGSEAVLVKSVREAEEWARNLIIKWQQPQGGHGPTWAEWREGRRVMWEQSRLYSETPHAMSYDRFIKKFESDVK